MKLFIDEDIGTRVPRALKLVRMPCENIVYPSNSGPIRFGTKDIDWIPWVGQNGYLAFSRNHHILENEVEFDLVRQHGVGIVFVDRGDHPSWAILRMIMQRWEWLRLIDGAQRPFAYLVGLTGRPEGYDLTRGPREPRPYRAPAIMQQSIMGSPSQRQ